MCRSVLANLTVPGRTRGKLAVNWAGRPRFHSSREWQACWSAFKPGPMRRFGPPKASRRPQRSGLSISTAKAARFKGKHESTMNEAVKPDFRRKIVTLDDLASAIGRRPRNKSVIMCHGMFDIVHPGHLRHLMYAKEKADILIASITTDQHNQKANIRPYVPQDLRALNLAVLEMVDYVIIDPHPTPIEHILHLQPDYFAKGYEYFSNGIPPHTQQEINALESYGGEMVFTPGDVVYSSSALIEAEPPKLGVEKLLALMQSEGVTFDDLRKTVTAMAGLKVLIVGDTILDGYSYCSLLGANAKSPTFSVKQI